MKNLFFICCLLIAAMLYFTGCEKDMETSKEPIIASPDGMIGMPFEGAYTPMKIQLKSALTNFIDFDDLTNPVVSDFYSAMGVQMLSSSDGILVSGPCPWNLTKSIYTDPFAGPYILFNFDKPISSCSIEAGDYGPSDDDNIFMTAYSGLNCTGDVLGSTSQFQDWNHPSQGLTLELHDLAGARSIKITSEGTFPNSIFVDNLSFEIGDTDGDGCIDDEDPIDNSNMEEFVTIESCSNGVENMMTSACGIMMSDMIDELEIGTYKNHGQFVLKVAQLAENWMYEGLITFEQKDLIVQCAGESSIGTKK